MPLLQIEGIVSGYTKELDILSGVSLKVEKGQMVSIIGPNGAGKSTVLKTIFGILKVRGGRIVFEDEDITNIPADQILQKGISIVPQGRNIFPLMTVRENLELGAFSSRARKPRSCSGGSASPSPRVYGSCWRPPLCSDFSS